MAFCNRSERSRALGGALHYNTTTGNWGKIGTYNKGSQTASSLNGAMDGVMFWDDSLTHTQVQNLYNNYYYNCVFLPTVTSSSSANVICAGESVFFVGAGANSYSWSGGVTDGVPFMPSSTTTYTVTGTDGNNCSDTATATITVIPLPDPTTVVNGNIITANLAGASYQWLDCNNGYASMAGESNQSYTALTNGSYAVRLYKDGCADTSACNTVSSVGINNNTSESDGITIFPNPASNQVTVSNQNLEKCKIDLIDYTGKIVYSAISTDDKTVLNISEYSNGLYFLKYSTEDGVHTQKLVINH